VKREEEGGRYKFTFSFQSCSLRDVLLPAAKRLITAQLVPNNIGPAPAGHTTPDLTRWHAQFTCGQDLPLTWGGASPRCRFAYPRL